jgi:hypothetical protein
LAWPSPLSYWTSYNISTEKSRFLKSGMMLLFYGRQSFQIIFCTLKHTLQQNETR